MSYLLLELLSDGAFLAENVCFGGLVVVEVEGVLLCGVMV